MSIHIKTLLLCLFCLCCSPSQASAEPAAHKLSATVRGETIPITFHAAPGSGPHPAVLLLGGSRGYVSPAYGEIAHTFNAAGLDLYLVHYLTPQDIQRIEKAASASERKRHAATRQAFWLEAVRSALAYVVEQPRHLGAVGLVGISLGANLASRALPNPRVKALVLIDGGDSVAGATDAKALLLVWGEQDTVFPLSIALRLEAAAHERGRSVQLDIHPDAGHDFFIRPGSAKAAAAHLKAARFLIEKLAR